MRKAGRKSGRGGQSRRGGLNDFGDAFGADRIDIMLRECERLLAIINKVSRNDFGRRLRYSEKLG